MKPIILLTKTFKVRTYIRDYFRYVKDFLILFRGLRRQAQSIRIACKHEGHTNNFHNIIYVL